MQECCPPLQCAPSSGQLRVVQGSWHWPPEQANRAGQSPSRLHVWLTETEPDFRPVGPLSLKLLTLIMLGELLLPLLAVVVVVVVLLKLSLSLAVVVVVANDGSLSPPPPPSLSSSCCCCCATTAVNSQQQQAVVTAKSVLGCMLLIVGYKRVGGRSVMWGFWFCAASGSKGVHALSQLDIGRTFCSVLCTVNCTVLFCIGYIWKKGDIMQHLQTYSRACALRLQNILRNSEFLRNFKFGLPPYPLLLKHASMAFNNYGYRKLRLAKLPGFVEIGFFFFLSKKGKKDTWLEIPIAKVFYYECWETNFFLTICYIYLSVIINL